MTSRFALNTGPINLTNFDSDWYLKTYPDVALSGLSPEEHYKRFGAMLNRAGNKIDAQQIQTTSTPTESKIGHPTFGRRPTPSARKVPPRPFPTGNAIQLCKNGIVINQYRNKNTMAKMALPVAIWLRQMNIPIKEMPEPILAPNMTSARATNWKKLTTNQLPVGALQTLQFGNLTITNAGMVTDNVLRITIGDATIAHDKPYTNKHVLRMFQADPTNSGTLTQISAAEVSEGGHGFVNAELLNPLMPVLIELADAQGYTTGQALLPFPSLMPSGLHASERAAMQTGATVMEDIWRLSSLLLADIFTRDETQNKIRVDLSDATGSERIFSPYMRDWLQFMFALEITPLQTTRPNQTGPAWLYDNLIKINHESDTRKDSELILDLPAVGIPTLSFLVGAAIRLSQGTKKISGPFLVADEANLTPRWMVNLPSNPALRLQTIGIEKTSLNQPILTRKVLDEKHTKDDKGIRFGSVFLAILFRPSILELAQQRFFPVAPDAQAKAMALVSTPPSFEHISIAVTARNPALFGRFLDGVVHQASLNGPRPKLLIRSPEAPESDLSIQLEAVANRRGFTQTKLLGPPEPGLSPELDRIAAGTNDKMILLADEDIILHDPTVLSNLVGILEENPEAGSVSPTLLYEPHNSKLDQLRIVQMGIFPDRVSFFSSPNLGFCEPDALDALPSMLYPVLANSFAICLIRRDMIEKTAVARAGTPKFDAARALTENDWGARDIQFALEGSKQGFSSLCCTSLRAITTIARVPRDQIDPFGISCLDINDWQKLFNSITVLRKIRK